MPVSHILLLSLLLSVGVGGVGLAAGRVLEGVSDDPVLRDRLWGALLALPLVPPLLAGVVLMLTPAPVVVVPAPVVTPMAEMAAAVIGDGAPSAPVSSAPALLDLTPWVIAAVLGVLVLLAVLRLARRSLRLARLVRAATPSTPELARTVDDAARAVGTSLPLVRISPAADEPLLVGLWRPRLVMPADFAAGDAAGRAVIAHELAHLKRGDHRAVWWEEGVMILLAFNPFAASIRARRSAAREEACDALALAGAATTLRRAYAQSLVAALRSTASPVASLPALTFTGTPRSQAMRRLKSILTPPAASRRPVRLLALAGAVALTAASGAAGIALANQRAAETQVAPSAEVDDWPQRYLTATARDGQLYCAAPDGNRDRTFGCDVILWNVAEQEQRAPTQTFCAPSTKSDADLGRIAAEGRARILASTDVSGSAQDGARRALAAAYPCGGAAPRPFVVSPDRAAALSAEWAATRAAQSAAESAAIAAHLRTQTAADIKAMCRAGDKREPGCDGFIFGLAIGENMKPVGERRYCAPENEDQATALSDRMKSAIASTPAMAPDEPGRAFVVRVMTDTYPCRA